MKVTVKALMVAIVVCIMCVAGYRPAKATSGLVKDCSALLSSRSSHVTEAVLIPAAGATPAYCLVRGTLPKAVNYEVRLPATGWNGKFLHVGGGAFCGSPPASSLDQQGTDALARGYAVTATDTGHSGSPLDGSFAYKNPLAEIDWGFRSVHIVTVAAKQVIREYFGKAPRLSYWSGCSTGGRQGLMEAQRFPGDFDGMIIGAPSHYFTGLNGVWGVWLDRVNRDAQGQQILTLDKIGPIGNAVYAACDAADGLADGIIDDPRVCSFDPGSMVCGSGPGCLSEEQADVVRKIYDCPRDSRGNPLYPGGVPKGSEAGWPVVTVGMGGQPPIMSLLTLEGLRYMNFLRDPGPDYTLADFDLDRDPARLAPMGRIYNASDSNMRGFRNHGGKMILYQGWGDVSVLPDAIIYYYEQMAKQMGGTQALKRWARLFMVPGMGHCSGGNGPFAFDALTTLEGWVEKGVEPDRITAAHITADGSVDRTRPLCPYPMVARYTGSGSIDDEAAFDCTMPPYATPSNDWDGIRKFPWDR